MRDKNKNRDQLPFELLRECSSSSTRGRGIGQFSQRRAERDQPPSSRQAPPHDEEGTRIGQFWGRVKGVASKGKGAISAKYESSKVAFGKRSGKEEDDVVELLATGGGSGSNGRGRGHRARGALREPPKDLFQEI